MSELRDVAQILGRYKKLRCPGRPGRPCSQVFGVTDGERLFLSSGTFVRSVTIHCPRSGCGGKLEWRSGRRSGPS